MQVGSMQEYKTDNKLDPHANDMPQIVKELAKQTMDSHPLKLMMTPVLQVLIWFFQLPVSD